MRDADVLVFVEVRYRASATFGSALESVTFTKQQRLRRAARHFLVHNTDLSRLACRFDVVALSPRRGRVVLEWIRNAF
jgi:putative endonuclease